METDEGRAVKTPEAASSTQRLNAIAAPGASKLMRARVAIVLAGALLIPQAGLIAWCMQRAFIDHVEPRTLLPLLLALAGTMLARTLLNAVARTQADQAVEQIRTQLRRDLLPRLFARGPRWLRRQRSGELAEVASGHVDALEGYFGGFLPVRTEVMLVPLLILIAVFCVDRIVGVVLLVTLPLAPIFMMLVGMGAEAASRQQLQALARLGGHFADRLRGLGLIRLYGRGDAELHGIEQAAEGVRQRSLKVLRIAFLSSTVLEFFASVSVAMIALYLGLTYLGMIHWRASPLELATGMFCLLLAPEFYAPLRRLATHYHDRAAALAAVDEIERLLETDGGTPLSPRQEAARSPAAPSLTVESLQLRAHADAAPLCAPISFAVASGEHVALAGASGVGKTTLLETLAGWVPVEAGAITFSANPRIGYAPQRPFLFHGSLADNLRLAAPEASQAELLKAAEAAQVMQFAARLPRGLDTVVGERGFGLSGGEARRVALARLFLRDPDVWLLDEPTAFLDPDTEQAVLDALLHFARGRTLIIATHSEVVLRRLGRVLRLDANVSGRAP